MTAQNVYVRKDGVHILSDGAFLGPDGSVRAIVPKVRILPHLNAVLTVSGEAEMDAAFHSVFSSSFIGFDQLASGLADAVRATMQGYPHIFPSSCNFTLFLAGWSKFYGCGKALSVFYVDPNEPEDGFSPEEIARSRRAKRDSLKAFEVVNWSSPWVPSMTASLAPLGIDPSSPGFDPVKHGLAVLEAQRAEKITVPGWQPAHIVGGFAQHTIITADGITTRVLMRWPDAVGEKIAA